jgi:hypothetical protein
MSETEFFIFRAAIEKCLEKIAVAVRPALEISPKDPECRRAAGIGRVLETLFPETFPKSAEKAAPAVLREIKETLRDKSGESFTALVNSKLVWDIYATAPDRIQSALEQVKGQLKKAKQLNMEDPSYADALGMAQGLTIASSGERSMKSTLGPDFFTALSKAEAASRTAPALEQ